MPLYVVRWPDLRAALVRAANADELLEILDQVADPQGCTWTEYDGPLFLAFELAARVEIEPGASGAPRPLDPERLRIVGTDALASRQVAPMTVSPAGDSGDEMLEAVARFAFPATAAAYWDHEHDPDREEIEQALRVDALRLVELTWRRCHEQRDPQRAIDVHATMRWIKTQCARMAVARNANESAGHVLGVDGPGQQAPANGRKQLMASLDQARVAWLEKRPLDMVRKLLLQTLLLLEEQR